MPHTFDTALVAIGGRKVLIVAMRPWVLADPHERTLAHAALRMVTGLPTVLLAQEPDGRARLDGDPRFVRSIVKLGLRRLIWQARAIDFARPA